MKQAWQEISVDSEIQVPFHDVDMANMAWHGHYVKYLEVARCELLDQINYNYGQMGDSGYYWPIIDLRVRYVNPSLFGQKILVNARFEEWEHRLKIRYLITDAESGKRLTKATTTQVAVEIASGEMQMISPPVLAEKMGIEIDV